MSKPPPTAEELRYREEMRLKKERNSLVEALNSLQFKDSYGQTYTGWYVLTELRLLTEGVSSHNFTEIPEEFIEQLFFLDEEQERFRSALLDFERQGLIDLQGSASGEFAFRLEHKGKALKL